MLKELPVAELVQRINFNEVTEVAVTCTTCKTGVILPLQKCRMSQLRCPGCDADLRAESTTNPLGQLAFAILKLQENAKQPGAAQHEFILKAPAKAG